MSDLVEWLTACVDNDIHETSIWLRGFERKHWEIARNRRVLKRHRLGDDGECAWCSLIDPSWGAYPCDDIRDLASIYADRPGYQAKWGPR